MGTEEFTITQRERRRGGHRPRQVDLRLADGEPRTLARCAPRAWARTSADVDVSGDAPGECGHIGGGRGRQDRHPRGSSERVRASNGAVVLASGCAPYTSWPPAPPTARPIIVPRENRQVMATVSSRGEEAVQVGGRSARLFHLLVRPQGGTEANVWVDDLNRVIKVEIQFPGRRYLAERTELPR